MLRERYLPFLVVGLVLSGLIWGLSEVPNREDTFQSTTAQSTDEVPFLMEYFPGANCIDCYVHSGSFTRDVPSSSLPDTVWLTWAENGVDPLGILAGEIRAESHNVSAPAMAIDGVNVSAEEGEEFHPVRTMEAMSDHLREAEHQSAGADIDLTLKWVDGPAGLTLNMSIDIHTLERLSDTTILEMYILEDGLETRAGQPLNHVVRLYRFTLGFHHGEGLNSTHWEAFPLQDLVDYDLPADARESHDWTFVVTVRDKESGVVHAALESPLPPTPFGPVDTGERVKMGLLAAPVIFIFAFIAHAEWRRENLLPRLHGATAPNQTKQKVREGVAILRAGQAAVTLKSVKAEPPWRLSGKSPTLELETGEQQKIRVKFRAQDDAALDTSVRSKWSLDVDGMAAWVMDLEFDPPK